MATIDEKFLNDEIARTTAILNMNIAELVKAETMVEQLKEVIAVDKGGIGAFEYLVQRRLKEEETENGISPMTLEDIEEMTGGKVEEVVTTKPDDSDSGEEA